MIFKKIFKNKIRFLLKKLEVISYNNPNRIIRLKGFIKTKEGESQDLEILIYKGIVSSTTHHTNFDLEEPVIPKYTEITSGEILEAPMIPEKENIIFGPANPIKLINVTLWR